MMLGPGAGPQGSLCPQGLALSRPLLLIHQTLIPTSGKAEANSQESEPDKAEVPGLWSGVGTAAVLALLGDPTRVPSVSPSVEQGEQRPQPHSQWTRELDEGPWQDRTTVMFAR